MNGRIFIAFIFSIVILNTSIAQTPDTLGLSKLSSSAADSYEKQLKNYNFYERVLTFSDISWVSLPFTDWGIGDAKSPYILSADISPQFTIGGEKWPIVIQATPRYKVRIMRDDFAKGDSSLPVRTPSYMPGASIYVPLPYSWIPFKKLRDSAIEEEKGYFDLHYVGISLFHHSNGQDGTEINQDGSINTYNGNFSTNFLELSYNFNIRERFMDPPKGSFICNTNILPVGYFDLYGKVAIEQHFYTAYDLKQRYGKTKLNIKLGVIKVGNWRMTIGKDNQVGNCYKMEHYRFVSNFTFNIGNQDQKHSSIDKRLNAEIGYYKRLLAGNTALFVISGYYGSDPYNIYFEESYPFIRTGVALGFFTFTRKTN